jgi:hypothetical protein
MLCVRTCREDHPAAPARHPTTSRLRARSLRSLARAVLRDFRSGGPFDGLVHLLARAISYPTGVELPQRERSFAPTPPTTQPLRCATRFRASSRTSAGTRGP